ncbi:hypothetical protein H257_15907 [Aphanomyces astaci]|uniref:Uncharacterized protein n=1 Tax=Aphanomyces astaci TaxID=112090 RepID=W4FMJ4_APHAT|nr:hypothetical protein H257_15907 [Aphanomyces astaci]ETV67918.1 hypothetical protein H257_15907 [Aphanomyces astaci]|eukprot:XP_009842481.1 hypothetical protein H257_15907 [Aphanomyces astaci]
MWSTESVIPTTFKQKGAYFTSFGGSLMCPETRASGMITLFQLIKRDLACGMVVTANLYPTTDILLISVLASRLSLATQSQVDVACWHNSNYDRCRRWYVTQSTRLVRELVHPTDIALMEALASAASRKVIPLRIALMQYVRDFEASQLQIGRSLDG